MTTKSLAIKRINKDIKEITKSPIEGIGIVSLSNDPMNYIVNIKLLEGPYKNYCVQLLLTFPENYPTKPPKMLIYPNQAIDNQYHHHIFPDLKRDENGKCFKKFCIDLLDNDFMSTKDEYTGWNPSYTISSVLLQVQHFLSDPDMHGHIPEENKIKQLMDSMNNYQRSFPIINDKGEKEIITHTWANPYPEMFFKKENENNSNDNKNEEIKDKNFLRMEQIKENLTCFMTKSNYIDEPDILLGYPIIQNQAGKNKIELYPIPELLTYDGFVNQIGKQDMKLDYYFDIKFKSANNQLYNYWIPIYIDENHFKKNRTAILNSFSIIKYGALGIKEYDFKPEHIFEVLPIILNKMIIGMFNGKTTISSAFIRCYFHYVLLFKKLCLEFEDDYCKYVNHILNLVKKNNYQINKTIIPDIGNFLMLLFFSNRDTHSEKMKKIWYLLFEDSAARRPRWTFYGDDCKEKMKNLILKFQEPVIDEIYLKQYELEEDYHMIHENLFIKDLKSHGLYDQLVDIFKEDTNINIILTRRFFYMDNYGFDMIEPSDYIRQKKPEYIKEEMDNNFKELYNKCTSEIKKKANKILQKLMFSYYFKPMQDEDLKKYEELTEKRNELYDNYKIDELLKDKRIKNMDEILKFIFENQKGNKLFIITFITAKKIENPEFMKELENNYGIYLDVDTFIKEMNQKLSEIKSLNEMYKFIGSEYGQDKIDLEIIIDSYEKAKQKGYLFKIAPIPNKSSIGINDSRGFRGGRGRDGRGGRGTRGGRGGRWGRGGIRRGGY